MNPLHYERRERQVMHLLGMLERDMAAHSPRGIGRWEPSWQMIEAQSRACQDVVADYLSGRSWWGELLAAVQQVRMAWMGAVRAYEQQHGVQPGNREPGPALPPESPPNRASSAPARQSGLPSYPARRSRAQPSGTRE